MRQNCLHKLKKAQKAGKSLSGTPFLKPPLLRPCPSNETTTKDRPSCSGEEWAVKVHTVPKILTQRLKLSATRPGNEVSQILAGTMKAYRCISVRRHAQLMMNCNAKSRLSDLSRKPNVIGEHASILEHQFVDFPELHEH